MTRLPNAIVGSAPWSTSSTTVNSTSASGIDRPAEWAEGRHPPSIAGDLVSFSMTNVLSRYVGKVRNGHRREDRRYGLPTAATKWPTSMELDRRRMPQAVALRI